MSPEEIINNVLVEQHGTTLEDVIAEATEGRAGTARVSSTAIRLDRFKDEDGSVSEFFEGVLTVDDVRYRWQASVFTDVDGAKFVTDIRDFKPLDWRARMRIVN
jgi:hypothetical protein